MPSRRVLLTEPPLNPKKNREKLMEVISQSLHPKS
jgi:actin-related protein